MKAFETCPRCDHHFDVDTKTIYVAPDQLRTQTAATILSAMISNRANDDRSPASMVHTAIGFADLLLGAIAQ